MKKLLTILAVVFFVGQTWAQTTEYLQQKDFKVEKQKLNESINASRKQLNEIKKVDLKMRQSIDSLEWLLGYSTAQLRLATDSLSKTSVKLNALQEKVDSEKFLSRGLRILIVLILFLLFIILFVMIYLFKKKAELNHHSLLELDKKTNERLELEIKNIKAEIQHFKELIGNNTNEMNQRISTGLNSFETKTHQLEQHIKENLVKVEGRIDIIGPEISKFKEEQSYSVKTLDEKLNAIKREMEQRNQALSNQTAKLEEEVRLFKGKH